MKRAFDVIVSACAIVLTAPLLLIASLAIVIETGRPVLFRQTRLGRDQKPFEILKLRTMHRSGTVDQVAEKVVSSGRDARVTRVGRILRATSLDELPQLWNVLRGEMSLVGPRPILPEQLAAVPDAALARFAVQPGITGLAQVRGRRNLSWLDQLAADVEYSEKASVFADIRIMVETVWVVLTGKGLYPGDVKNWRDHLTDGKDTDKS